LRKDLTRIAVGSLLAACGIVAGTVLAAPFGARIIAVLLGSLPTGRLVFSSGLEPLMVNIKGALYGGVFLAVPWVLWRLWLLFGPERYRRGWAARAFVLCATVLFYAGAAFAHEVVLPRTLSAMASLETGFPAMVSVSGTSAYVMECMVEYGLAFEVPLLVAVALMGAHAERRRTK
jgi:sec-independent protein translocase protein TatC